MEIQSQPVANACGDFELLHLMATADDDAARDAWKEFHIRHVGYLYGVCQRALKATLWDHRIDDVVQDSLLKVFQKAATFHGEPHLDFESQRRMVRAWLGKICENLVVDCFRDQPLVDFVDPDVLATHRACEIKVGEEEGRGSTPSLAQLVGEAFDILTEREQEVLNATAMWYKPGQKAQKLPNSVMTELTTSLKTNSANVRKIRERAVAKVRSYVESHQQSSKE
jgi:DNA-directed RNA polymerase specialized sigma24 family protein